MRSDSWMKRRNEDHRQRRQKQKIFHLLFDISHLSLQLVLSGSNQDLPLNRPQKYELGNFLSRLSPRPIVTAKPMTNEKCQMTNGKSLTLWLGEAHHSLGSSIVKMLPFPSSEVTVTSPPCARARCFTIARPRPVPPISRERARSAR